MKKLISIGILGVFLAFVFVSISCGSSPSQEGVMFWHAMGGPLGETLDKIINDFNREHPDKDPILSVHLGHYNTLSQKLMGAVAAHRPPVMSQVYGSWTSEFLEAGKIVPFSNYIGEGKPIPQAVIDSMFPVFRDENTWGDSLITLPFNKSILALYYNADLFKQYGIEKPPETWDEFKEIAKKLTIDLDGDGTPDIYGHAFVVNVWTFETLLFQNGGRLFDENGQPAFNSPEGVAALQYMVDLLQDGCAYLTTGYKHQDDFAAGRVAMVLGSVVSYSFMKRKITFNLGIAPVPHGKKKVYVISGTNVALYSGKSVPESKRIRAAEFVNYFYRPDVQAYWSVNTGYMPVVRQALNDPQMQDFFEEVPGMKEVYDQINYAIFEPRDPVWSTGRRILSEDGLEPALRGVMPPAEALERAARLISHEVKIRSHKVARRGKRRK